VATKTMVFGAVATLLTLSAANADTLNIGQFLPDQTLHAAPLSGITSAGVDYTIISPSGTFETSVQSLSWSGMFADTTPVLFDNGVPGPVIFDFASSLQSLTVALESNNYGLFNEFGAAYNGNTPVASASVSDLTSANKQNTAVYFTLASATGFDAVALSTTNDSSGFGIASAPGPTAGAGLPALLAMLAVSRVCRRKSDQNAKRLFVRRRKRRADATGNADMRL